MADVGEVGVTWWPSCVTRTFTSAIFIAEPLLSRLRRGCNPYTRGGTRFA